MDIAVTTLIASLALTASAAGVGFIYGERKSREDFARREALKLQAACAAFEEETKKQRDLLARINELHNKAREHWENLGEKITEVETRISALAFTKPKPKV